MTLSTSAVAVCCCSDSRNSFSRREIERARHKPTESRAAGSVHPGRTCEISHTSIILIHDTRALVDALKTAIEEEHLR